MLIETANLLQIPNAPPNDLILWLNHQDSLMEKLKTLTGEAKLEVLQQHWTKPNWWDKFTLGLSAEPVLHRNILVASQQIPCWFARTIIPTETYQANQHFFNRLSHEPLGVIVFNEPSIKRIHFVNYQISKQCSEYYWLPSLPIDEKMPLWVRLSIFANTPEGTRFYLVEILLPGLMRLLSELD